MSKRNIAFYVLFNLIIFLTSSPTYALILEPGDIVVSGTVINIEGQEEGALVRISPNTKEQEIISSGGQLFGAPNGIAFESNTSILLGSNQEIIRINTIDGSQEVIFDGAPMGFSLPGGIAIDDNNDIYAIFLNGHALIRIDPINGTSTLIADFNSAGINSPRGMTIDDNGHILIANSGAFSSASKIISIDPNAPFGQNSSTLTSGNRLKAASGVAITPNGDMFFSDLGSQSQTSSNPFGGGAQIVKFNPDLPGMQELVTSDGLLVDVTSIASNAAGELFIVNAISGGRHRGNIIKIDPNNPVQNIFVDFSNPDSLISRISNSISGEIAIFPIDGDIDTMLQTLAANFDYIGIDTILSTLDAQQLSALLPATLTALDTAGVALLTSGNDYSFNSGAKVSIHGLDGNDVFHGGVTDTHMFGGNGDDTLYAFRGGNNTLYGGNGMDTLGAGNGDDILYGGDGSDFMTGGAGADTFVFRQGDTGVDRIYMTPSAGDRLDISDFLDQYNPLLDNINDFVILTEGFSTHVFVDADGQGAGQAVEIVEIIGLTGLNVEDIIDVPD